LSILGQATKKVGARIPLVGVWTLRAKKRHLLFVRSQKPKSIHSVRKSIIFGNVTLGGVFRKHNRSCCLTVTKTKEKDRRIIICVSFLYLEELGCRSCFCRSCCRSSPLFKFPCFSHHSQFRSLTTTHTDTTLTTTPHTQATHSTHTAHTQHTHSTHTAHTQHTHSTHTAHTQHTHSTHTAHTLHTHSTHTARTLHTHSTHTARTQHAHCTHTAHTHHTHCTHTPHTATRSLIFVIFFITTNKNLKSKRPMPALASKSCSRSLSQ
jgi:hypothetical protein